MNVHIDVDQSVQSEPRLRLLLAENLLRDTTTLIQRMEVRSQMFQEYNWVKSTSGQPLKMTF